MELKMKNTNNFEQFLYRRLESILSSINNKFNTNLELIGQYLIENNVHEFDSIIWLKNEPFIFVEFRYRIQERLIEKYRNEKLFNLPILIVSQSKFLIIEHGKVATYDITSLTSVILKIVRRKIHNILKDVKLNVFNMLIEEIRLKFKLKFEINID